MSRGTFERATALDRLRETSFDVLVIGGGITGCGVALDAASRGLRTALVERDDFASGTSSKSSKLVHGGLRYLQNGDVRLVYEALRERHRLRKNAPHLVSLLPFLIPVLSRDGVISKKLAKALGSAMWMYDLTGGFRIGKLHKKLDADEVAAHMPTLPTEHLAGGYLYWDATADDARLTLAIARTAAVEFGAAVANHTAVIGLTKDPSGRATGATVEADGERFDVRATTVVNATGVWADDIRTLDEGTDPDSLRPAKGIHITLPWAKVRNDLGVIIPVPKDKRSVFVVPWPSPPGVDPEFSYVGTTDTDYDGPVDDPQCTDEDIDYLLDALNHSMSEPVSRDDIVGTWAGLRPLVKSEADGRTADLSRSHQVTTSDAGVVTVTGGKLTTYREMAEDTMEAVVSVLGDDLPRTVRKCRTRRLPLLGASDHDESATGTAGHLQGRYGDDSRVLDAMIDRDPTLAEPLVEGLPYLRAEARYAVRYEMATDLDDVLTRRTRARLLARDASADAAAGVAELIAPDLGWTAEEQQRQVDHYRATINAEQQSISTGQEGRSPAQTSTRTVATTGGRA
jgi:glycerol-3-phosphate dehydrogenase